MKTRINGIRRWFHLVWARTLICLLLAMIPLFLLGAAISSWSQNELSSQIMALNQAQIYAGLELMDSEMEKILSLESGLLFDTDINRLGVIPGHYTKPKATQAMLRVQERMLLLAGSSTLASSAFLLAPSIGKIISDSGVDDLDLEFAAVANTLCVNRPRWLLDIDGEHYLMMAYPAYTSYLKSKGSLYMIGVRLDAQTMQKTLAGMITQENECVMLLDEMGNVVAMAGSCAEGLQIEALFTASRTQGAFDYQADGGASYRVLAASSQVGQLTLIKVMSGSDVFKPLITQRALFLLLFALAVAANLLYAIYLWHYLHKPLRTLSGAFGKLETGELSTRIHHVRDDDFADIYHRFNHMSERLEELIDQMYLQKIRLQQAELKQLQSQINPHFLYNSFFMLKAFARMNDVENVEKITDELGEYYRYVTRSGDSEMPLEKEIAHARHYAAIQNMRFQKRVRLDFGQMPPEIASLSVPRLILQPLLENAYGHGLSETQENGLLRVRFIAEDSAARIIVEDNGQSLTDEALQSLQLRLADATGIETTGLINIHQRVQLRFGKEWGITAERSELGGLKITLSIPGRR